MAGRLEGRVALVTGATGGIGGAIVGLFATAGAHLVLSGTRASRPEAPGDAVYLPGDVTDEGYAQALIAACQDRFGRLDILVNAHGVDYHSDLAATSLEEAERIIRVNLLGTLATMKYALQSMRSSGGGSIVNIASRLGQIAIPGQAVYSASKGGLIMLSRGAAIDEAPHGIRVNCVLPGITATPMIDKWVADQSDPAAFAERIKSSIPLGRLARPEDVAFAVMFLASDESSYITGALLPVDGGYTAT